MMIASPNVPITSSLQTREYLACQIWGPEPVLCSCCCCCCWRLDPLLCLSEIRRLLFFIPSLWSFLFLSHEDPFVDKISKENPLVELATISQNARSFYFKKDTEWVFCIVVFSTGEECMGFILLSLLHKKKPRYRAVYLRVCR